MTINIYNVSVEVPQVSTSFGTLVQLPYTDIHAFFQKRVNDSERSDAPIILLTKQDEELGDFVELAASAFTFWDNSLDAEYDDL